MAFLLFLCHAWSLAVYSNLFTVVVVKSNRSYIVIKSWCVAVLPDSKVFLLVSLYHYRPIAERIEELWLHIINRHNCINWWKIQNAEQGCRSVVVCCLGLGWSSPGHKAIIIWSSSFVIVFKKCTPSFSNITWHKRLLQYSMDLVSVHWLPFSIFMDLLLAARRCKYIHCIRFPLCHNGNTPVACSVYGNYVLRQSRLTTISVRWSHLLDHWRWSLVRNALYMTQCSSSHTSPRGDRSVLWCWMEMGLMCHSLQTFVTF